MSQHNQTSGIQGSGLRSQSVKRALGQLLALISAGAEYPTAHERVVAHFDLSDKQADALTAAYDAHCAEESAMHERADALWEADEAAFERRYEGEHRERDEPNKFGERP